MYPCKPFKPERGIRQVDLISPYIFIICAEYLDRYTHFIANIPKSSIVVKIAKNGPVIPYLIFVDDCMIFCED